MQTATSSPENQRYNDESNFLDGLYEFHREFFNELTEAELGVLRRYYIVGGVMPENVFAYRHKIAQQQPELEHKAHEVFAKLVKLAGIDKFHYLDS